MAVGPLPLATLRGHWYFSFPCPHNYNMYLHGWPHIGVKEHCTMSQLTHTWQALWLLETLGLTSLGFTFFIYTRKLEDGPYKFQHPSLLESSRAIPIVRTPLCLVLVHSLFLIDEDEVESWEGKRVLRVGWPELSPCVYPPPPVTSWVDFA